MKFFAFLFLFLANLTQNHEKSCNFYLSAYQKSHRSFNLKRTDHAIHRCELAQDFKTAEMFLDFRKRYLETHSQELNSKKGIWADRDRKPSRPSLFADLSGTKPVVKSPSAPAINWTWGREKEAGGIEKPGDGPRL